MPQPQNAVSDTDVRKIARLARIRVEDAEVSHLAGEINGILGWIEQLGEVDVAAPLRADRVTDGGIRDKVLANAPEEEDGFFVVPRSVE